MVQSNLTEGIAFQIKATRNARNLTQARLAELSGMTQNNLSRLEDPDYGKHTLSSLKRIAEALDVALAVRFVPYSQYIDWLSGTPFLDEGLRPEALAVPNFGQEEAAGKMERTAEIFSMQKTLPTPQVCAECTTKMLNTLFKISPEIAELNLHIPPTVHLAADSSTMKDDFNVVDFPTPSSPVNSGFQLQGA